MTKVLSMTLLFYVFILHLTSTVFTLPHYGRDQKHYAGGTAYHRATDAVATSHPTDITLHSPSSRHRKGEYMDNASSNLYAMVDNPSISEEYLDPFNEQQLQQMADNTLLVNHQQMSTCQTVCACKWKGGKQTVECIDQSLQRIPENIDPSTQVLDMSGNRLQTLHDQQFLTANLLNLQKLYLRNCRIEHIEERTFEGLTNLVELDLSQNLLTKVPSMAITFASSLRELTLASNRIQNIDIKAFANVRALNKLDLSHCHIQLIAPLAFGGLPGLTFLRLNGNKLSELVPKTIETLSRLHGIELHDNPWICDCRLIDLKVWLMQRNIAYPVAPACAGGPERILDQSFADLSTLDFACKPRMIPTNHYVETISGENASIECTAKAEPPATINWYWNGRLLTNNTAFSSYQRLQITEHGGISKTSRLLLTNAQEIDSSEFFCVAENRAGSSEANFTLHVKMRAAGMALLGSGQIVGLSAALVVLILFVLVFVMFLLMRLKREPYNATKTPNHMEVITSINQQNMIINKTQANGTVNSSNTTTVETKTLSDELVHIDGSGSENTNPLQKPPRLLDMAYATSNYDKAGSVLVTAPCFISPTASAGNNPDLINDTKRFEGEEFSDLKIPPILTKALATDLSSLTTNGDYKRAGGCDSLYPSGLWEDIASVTCTSSADDLFLRRYSDKTPIMDNKQLYDMHDGSTSNENFSKTFPRSSFNQNLLSNEGSCNINTESTASTTTTNLSNSGSGIVVGGYPNDYGLPVVPGAELQLNHHMQMNSLQKQLFGGTLGRSGNSNPLSRATLMSSNSSTNSSPPFTSRTLPRQKPTTNFDANSSRSSPVHNNVLINPASVNAKTIRVWQKGGVPVLPPVTAIKRALISTSRNSPDEGYQEGCGTDV